MSDPRIADKATEDRPPRGEGPEVSDDAEDADDIDLDEDEETRPYPGRPRAPKRARPRPGAGVGELSDEASALVERFAKGLTGRLSSPIQMDFEYPVCTFCMGIGHVRDENGIHMVKCECCEGRGRAPRDGN